MASSLGVAAYWGSARGECIHGRLGRSSSLRKGLSWLEEMEMLRVVAASSGKEEERASMGEAYGVGRGWVWPLSMGDRDLGLQWMQGSLVVVLPA